MDKKELKKKQESDEESIPYVMMDIEDEKQIVAEMQGEIIHTFVYSYSKDGREIMGLSKVGVDNVCRESANKGEVFRVIGDPIIRDSEDAIEIAIKVGRFSVKPNGTEIMLDTTFGAKRQPKKKLMKGTLTPDPFYFETALSKAERNAKRKLLPESLIIEMIKRYKAEGKIKNLSQPTVAEKTTYWKAPAKKKDDCISKAQAEELKKIRQRHFADTAITTEMLLTLMAYYGAQGLGDIKAKDYQNIAGALENRADFDTLLNTKKEEFEFNKLEKEKNV